MNENIPLIFNDYHIYFWFFGLINSFTFIILLSSSTVLFKNYMGLLSISAIIPGLIIKLTIPFLNKLKILNYKKRIYFSTTLMITSIITLIIFNNLYIKLFGIILSSISSAIGESIFIPLATMISNKSISYWSSGSGFSGIIGSCYYLLITQVFNLSAKFSIGITIWLPLVILYLFNKIDYSHISADFFLDYRDVTKEEYEKWFKKYILPLSSVYFFEYLINLILLPNVTKINNKRYDADIYYPRYMLCYQTGVLISRSIRLISPNISVQNLEIFSFVQFLNLILFIFEMKRKLINNFIIIYILIFFEGLMGGFAYVFTFSKINYEELDNKKELCTLNTTIGEVMGQTLASIICILVNKINF